LLAPVRDGTTEGTDDERLGQGVLIRAKQAGIERVVDLNATWNDEDIDIFRMRRRDER
jgi:hypothetical protein